MAGSLKLGQDMPPASHDDWLQAVDQALRGRSAGISHDPRGFSRQPLYTENETPTGHDPAGLPGFAPYLRGTRPVNNKFLPWHIAQRVTPGREGDDNETLLTGLAGGMSAVLLDLRQGVPDAATLDALFDTVMLDITPVSLATCMHGMQAAEALVALRRRRGIDGMVDGFLNLDPLAMAALYGQITESDFTARLAGLVDLVADDCGLRLMTVSGADWHNMGASVVQELAWILASLTHYLRAFEAIGIKPAQALTKITLTLGVDTDFFTSLAKLRSARLLFANIADAVGADNIPPQIHAQTSMRIMSDIDPWANILRTTVAATATGIGGVDFLCVAPCTASSQSDNTLTRRIGRNVQLILQEESHIGHVTDAAGGCWYVENLTQMLAHHAWAEFQKIEASGGMAQTIIEGRVQAAIDAQRAALADAVDTHTLPLVGVTAFPNLEEAPLAQAETSEAGLSVSESLSGGITGLGIYRLATAFETLRRAAQPSKPRVFLACLGDRASFTPRANFATNIYAAGGLHAIAGDGGTQAEEIAAAFVRSGAKIAVICGSDTDYQTHAEKLANALRKAGAAHLALVGKKAGSKAGKPDNTADIDDYCFAGDHTLNFLQKIHATLGL